MKKPGKTIWIILAALFIFSMSIWAPANVYFAQAATLSQAYNNLKTNFPGTINQLKSADATLQDSEIEAFVNDLSSELQKKGTLTEQNIEGYFYDAALAVMMNGRHNKVVNAAIVGFNITWEDIFNKRIPQGFQDIKTALKMELLGPATPPSGSNNSGVGGGGGGGTTPTQNTQQTTPPGAVSPVSQNTFNDALSQAGNEGRIRLAAESDKTEIALNKEQMSKIDDSGKPVEMTVQGLRIVLPAGALDVPELKETGTAQVQMSVQKVSGDTGNRLAGKARFKVLGDIYELSVEAVRQNGEKVPVREFGTGVNVSLPVPEGYQGNSDELKSFLYDEKTGDWRIVGGYYDPVSKSVVFATSHFSKYALMEVKQSTPQPVIQFSDIKGHWAEKDILAMAKKGIVKGTHGKALPEQKVTRAQFATFLVLLLNIPQKGNDLPFADTDKSAWYGSTLLAAYKAGLITGYGNGRIGPDDSISREQMAVMVTKAMKYAGKQLPETGLTSFKDKDKIASWAAGSVAATSSNGILRGNPDNTFRPQANATRAEALVILSRLTDKL